MESSRSIEFREWRCSDLNSRGCLGRNGNGIGDHWQDVASNFARECRSRCQGWKQCHPDESVNSEGPYVRSPRPCRKWGHARHGTPHDSCVPCNHCQTGSNLPQQSQCPRCVGKGALLSSRLRYPQTFCALHDRTPILHLLVNRLASREIRLMNLDHGLLKRAPQIFRGGRAVRLNMVCCNNMVCFNTRHGALVCHFERTQLSCCTLRTVKRRPTPPPYCVASVHPQ